MRLLTPLWGSELCGVFPGSVPLLSYQVMDLCIVMLAVTPNIPSLFDGSSDPGHTCRSFPHERSLLRNGSNFLTLIYKCDMVWQQSSLNPWTFDLQPSPATSRGKQCSRELMQRCLRNNRKNIPGGDLLWKCNWCLRWWSPLDARCLKAGLKNGKN